MADLREGTDRTDRQRSGNGRGFAVHPLSTEAIAYLKAQLRLPSIRFPRRSDLSIYFIGAERGPIKIGISCNPKSRLRQLQQATHEPLTVLVTVPGTFEIEKALHSFYARERLTGEWFKPSKRLREFIEELRFPPTPLEEMF